jgi:hypothetical protein
LDFFACEHGLSISRLSFSFSSVLPLLETYVRPRPWYVGLASIAFVGRRLMETLSGLSFCDRAWISTSMHLSSTPLVGRLDRLCVEQAEVDEALGDPLFKSKGLLALETLFVAKS